MTVPTVVVVTGATDVGTCVTVVLDAVSVGAGWDEGDSDVQPVAARHNAATPQAAALLHDALARPDTS